MPVLDQTTSNSYTGNGVTTVFAYTFKLLDGADVLVTVDGVTKTLTTHYTVSGVGASGGGNITFLSAPANAAEVVIQRDMDYLRDTDYQDNGDLLAATLDEDIDRVVMQVQQVRDVGIRSIKIPAGETTDQLITAAAADRANKAVIFDASGNVTVSTDDFNDQLANVTAQAVAAAASASSASGSASTATTQAGIATTQAGIATSAASTATTQAGIATTQAGNASTSASAAQTAETNAETAETNAETALSDALAIYGSIAAVQSAASDAAASALAAQTAETNAETAETNAETAETNATASASTATTQAGIATAQAAIATTQAGTATTQAGIASASATSASASATAAANSAASAAAIVTGSTVAAGDGAVGSPSFTFGSDTDTGLYRIGANNLGVAVAGVKVLDVSSSAFTVGAGVNLVMASGQGIDFSATANSSGTMSSEVLSDYEEGTWTPVVRGSGTAGTYDLLQAFGHYTKVGRLVTLHCYITMAAAITGGGTADLKITGAPFSKTADQAFCGVVSTSGIDIAAGGALSVTSGSAGGTDASIYLRETNDNAANSYVQIGSIAANDNINFTLTYHT